MAEPTPEPPEHEEARQAAYDAARAATTFFAARTLEAALAFGAAVNKDADASTTNEAAERLRVEACRYHEVASTLYHKRLEALGIPPKTPGPDSPTAAE